MASGRDAPSTGMKDSWFWDRGLFAPKRRASGTECSWLRDRGRRVPESGTEGSLLLDAVLLVSGWHASGLRTEGLLFRDRALLAPGWSVSILRRMVHCSEAKYS
ncbi:hypothetical protein Nepgr_031067 [Nepenthes gracilis]|uniref:Uncharacterized protein n=1 Tax=Nepenthes gracilis TaxID=150966 RepID=A0AAD3THK9_NEPGR|nr:hypothetical protein Nepgr_031067 [Nepenthes gracilis]